MGILSKIGERWERFLLWCNEPLVAQPGGAPSSREVVYRLQREVQTSPVDPMVRLRLGRALMRDGRHDAAVRELRAAAQLFVRQQEARKARSTYRMILDLRPHDERAQRGFQIAHEAVLSESDDTEPTPLPRGEFAVPISEPELRPTVVKTAKKDRRRSPRVPWLGAEVVICTPGSSIVMSVCDLSANGLSLEGMGSSLDSVDSVSLKFRIPGREIVGTGRGVVSWRTRGADFRSRFGIALDEVDPDTRAAMLKHIARTLGWDSPEQATSRFRTA